jgi:anti-sigma regulatory factor (Ser/Thr protein kinase)
MSEKVALTFEPASGSTQQDVLRRIAREVEELGQRESWPDGLVFKVNLVLEEVGINILSYGGEGGELWPEFEIVIKSEEDALIIHVSDRGRPFDPFHDAPKPSIGADIEDRNIGGLGIYLVQTMMDDMSYEHSGGKNQLTMVARRE